MSVQAITAAISARDFSSTEKLVLMVLAFRANDQDGTCFPSLASLEEDTGCNLKTIRKALHALQASGWIVDTGKKVGNTSQITVWKVVFDAEQRVPKTEGYQKGKGTNFSAKGTNLGPESLPILVPVKGREKEEGKSASPARVREDFPDEAPTVPDSTPRRGQLSAFLRNLGVTITPIHPDLCQWVNSDLTDDEAQEAVDRARQRESKTGNTPIPAKYLAPIVADVISERAERLKKCPAVAATTPGSLSSINPNRGPHYASKQQTRSAIFDFACNPFAGHGESRKSVYGAIDGVSHQVEQCRVLN